MDQLVKDFLARHDSEFGYSVGLEFTSVEFVNARLTALGPAPVGELRRDETSGGADDALLESRQVHFAEGGGWMDAAIYDRDKLLAGASIEGPAIVQEVDSTTVIPPGARAEVDEYRNLIIDVRGMARV